MTVKEILRGLKSIIEEKENGVVEMDIKTGLIYPKICSDDYKILLDYITNLQQKDFESQKEIMKLKDKLEQQRKEYQDTYKDVRIETKEKNEQIANLQQKLEQYEKTQTYGDYVETVNKVVELQKENESYKKEMNYYKKQYYNCKSRIDKALIYLGKCDWNDKHCFENLINILNGSDENE